MNETKAESLRKAILETIKQISCVKHGMIYGNREDLQTLFNTLQIRKAELTNTLNAIEFPVLYGNSSK